MKVKCSKCEMIYTVYREDWAAPGEKRHRGGCGGIVHNHPLSAPTFNAQVVGVYAGHVVIQLPKQIMTRPEALNLAAWLVAIADQDDEFPELLTAVQSGGA